MTNPQILTFYGWWQLSVCLFAFLALISIWWHIGRKKGDLGQVWLALSVLSWSISGAVEVYFVYHGLPAMQLAGWRSIFSLFNSLFILLALPWFRYLPVPIDGVIRSRYWNYIVGLPFLFSLLPTLSKMFSAQEYPMISELDVYYAILTLLFLGSVLFRSFAKRRLMVLAYLSVICILVTFTAQVFKITGSNINQLLFSAIFKTSLIMIFFALALSWVKELVENVLPSADQLYLRLWTERQSDRLVYMIEMEGIPGHSNNQIALTRGHYELLHKFISRRIEGSDWLEIKPKKDQRPNKDYHIHDYNQLKRLIAALLDGLFGKGCWSKEQHEIPLKDTLFELSDRRERKIRLRLPAANLTMNS